jgi:hypothetical protein
LGIAPVLPVQQPAVVVVPEAAEVPPVVLVDDAPPTEDQPAADDQAASTSEPATAGFDYREFLGFEWNTNYDSLLVHEDDL